MTHASPILILEESGQQQHPQGDEGWPTAETGHRDRALDPTPL
jgi:hypothetical protein